MLTLHSITGRDESIVKMLLDTGKVDINSQSNSGDTSLIKAIICTFSRFSICFNSIIYGLWISKHVLQCFDHSRANMLTLKFNTDGREGILMTLLDTANIDVNLKNSLNETPLIVAIKST